MDTPTVGQRVSTCYGAGTITAFEHLGHHQAVYSDAFTPGARIVVRLDEPSRWPCHSDNSGDPHFTLNELQELQ